MQVARRLPAPQIRLVRQLRALQVFVIHSFIQWISNFYIVGICRSLQFLIKSTHQSWRYERKCVSGCFFWTQCVSLLSLNSKQYIIDRKKLSSTVGIHSTHWCCWTLYSRTAYCLMWNEESVPWPRSMLQLLWAGIYETFAACFHLLDPGAVEFRRLPWFEVVDRPVKPPSNFSAPPPPHLTSSFSTQSWLNFLVFNSFNIKKRGKWPIIVNALA